MEKCSASIIGLAIKAASGRRHPTKFLPELDATTAACKISITAEVSPRQTDASCHWSWSFSRNFNRKLSRQGIRAHETAWDGSRMNRIPFKPRTSALLCVLACILLAVSCKRQETSVATTQTIEVTAVRIEPRDVPITFEWLAQAE